MPLYLRVGESIATNCAMMLTWLPDGELNPGLPRDRRGSLPLDNSYVCSTPQSPDIRYQNLWAVGCVGISWDRTGALSAPEPSRADIAMPVATVTQKNLRNGRKLSPTILVLWSVRWPAMLRESVRFPGMAATSPARVCLTSWHTSAVNVQVKNTYGILLPKVCTLYIGTRFANIPCGSCCLHLCMCSPCDEVASRAPEP